MKCRSQIALFTVNGPNGLNGRRVVPRVELQTKQDIANVLHLRLHLVDVIVADLNEK